MSAKSTKRAPQDSPHGRMLAAYQAGDVKVARALAQELGGDDPEAQRLLAATNVDGRALLIGACALALGAIYLGAFIF